MRIFVAGASGVIGRELVPLLVEDGHRVAGMTRSPEKRDRLQALGAEPFVLDVYDREAVRQAVAGFGPDLVMDQLTDLPDEPERVHETAAANARIRTEGTRNLLDAAREAGDPRFVAQSIAWQLPGDAHASVEEHERVVLEAGGVVVRYGRFYGPGTYFPESKPDVPRIEVAEAARRTLPALGETGGIVTVAE